MPPQLRRHLRLTLALLAPPLVLIGCGGVPLNNQPAPQARAAGATKCTLSTHPSLPKAGSGRGGYYKDDGPGDEPPECLLETPDAEPRVEPYLARNSRPYVVFGTTYTPITDDRPLKQRGIGSWYGRKFHGQKTSTGELYDMYKMTAAHPTLPLPSYVRVTNLANGKQVIVRVNDRGPFHADRIIDLSYTAALKLGYLGQGSSQLEVERLLPDEIARINAARGQQLASAAQPVAVAAMSAEAPSPAAVEVLPVLAAPAQTDIRPLPLADPAPVPATPAVTAMPAAVGAGYYVQIGAFSQAANAGAARERLQRGGPAGLAPLEVVEAGNWYRIFSGPYASRADAAAAAEQLQQAGNARPVIVQR